jgi:hypothetical protein
MTPDQRFTLLIAGLGVIFTVMSGLLGLIWRTARASGETATQIRTLVEDVGRLTRALDDHVKWHLTGKR